MAHCVREFLLPDLDFNPDGSGAATNVITVKAGGILDLDLGAGADENLTDTNNSE